MKGSCDVHFDGSVSGSDVHTCATSRHTWLILLFRLLERLAVSFIGWVKDSRVHCRRQSSGVIAPQATESLQVELKDRAWRLSATCRIRKPSGPIMNLRSTCTRRTSVHAHSRRRRTLQAPAPGDVYPGLEDTLRRAANDPVPLGKPAMRDGVASSHWPLFADTYAPV